MSENAVIAGIDVAKAHLDVAVLCTPVVAERFANDEVSLARRLSCYGRYHERRTERVKGVTAWKAVSAA